MRRTTKMASLLSDVEQPEPQMIYCETQVIYTEPNKKRSPKYELRTKY